MVSAGTGERRYLTRFIPAVAGVASGGDGLGASAVPVMSQAYGQLDRGASRRPAPPVRYRAWCRERLFLHPGYEGGFYPAADAPVFSHSDDRCRPLPGIAGGE